MKKILKTTSEIILFLWGWKIVGTIPKLSKAIIVVAPHRKGTADVLLGWLVQNIEHIPNKKFLAKYELLQVPIVGWVLKKIGAIGVDRNREFSNLPKGHYRNEMVALINQEKEITLVIAPEGTRTQGVPWRRGFYEIAREAKIPVIMIAFDYNKKRVVINNHPLMIPSEGEDQEMLFKDKIAEWYEFITKTYRPTIS